MTLLTDFGLQDHYVGALKGVLLGIAPQAMLVDITHNVEAHNVTHGAIALWQIWSRFPPGTIHLAVVDPGVGTSRRIIVGCYAGRYVVAPDNGLITFVHRDHPVESMHIVENRRYFLKKVSATFHGRDILAPVAAHLANGVGPDNFGRETDQVVLLDVEYPAKVEGSTIIGRVLCVDRFGTLVTSIKETQIANLPCERPAREVFVDGSSVGVLRSTFGEVNRGDVVALVGGSGMVEIAVNQGRAADRFGPIESLHVEVR